MRLYVPRNLRAFLGTGKSGGGGEGESMVYLLCHTRMTLRSGEQVSEPFLCFTNCEDKVTKQCP